MSLVPKQPRPRRRRYLALILPAKLRSIRNDNKLRLLFRTFLEQNSAIRLFIYAFRFHLICVLKMMRLGVAIGSGGIKAVAAIPVLAMLESINVRICGFAGCSGGAVVASLGAFGLPAAEMERVTRRLLTRDLFGKLDWFGLVALAGSARQRRNFGLLKPDAIAAMFAGVFGTARIDRLPLPLALQVTDRDTGDGVILDRGSLTNALLASIAAPPLLPPVEIGGRRIIDGALSDPVPRHAAAGEGIDCVISIGTSVAANGLPMQGTAVSRDNNGFHIEIAFDRPIRWWNTHLAPALLEHGRTLADRICGQMERFLASAEIEQRRDRRTERSHR